ncbi:hypothetical protein BKA70DRAFT_464300 [Coprinopsis sp. MPI-PUGE-AT-0042]|nr:hypothetical protein BKA70DRAFT_464300 [Coprinopsis sp. MPI-PUGE-AT-0042]
MLPSLRTIQLSGAHHENPTFIRLLSVGLRVRPRGNLFASSLRTVSSILQHLHSAWDCRRMNQTSSCVKSQLGQLHQLKSLILAKGPFGRSVSTGLSLDKDCPSHLQCLGIDGVASPLAQQLLDCLINVRILSLKRLDGQGSNVSVHSFLKAHGRKLIVLKAHLSMWPILYDAPQCLNVDYR